MRIQPLLTILDLYPKSSEKSLERPEQGKQHGLKDHFWLLSGD